MRSATLIAALARDSPTIRRAGHRGASCSTTGAMREERHEATTTCTRRAGRSRRKPAVYQPLRGAAERNAAAPEASLLIGIGVIAAIIIIVCVFVFGGKESKPAQETPTVPITGLSDTSNKQAQGDSESTSNSDSQTQQSSVAPTKATFTYKVASGSSCLHETTRGRFELGIRRRDGTGRPEKSF